MASPK